MNAGITATFTVEEFVLVQEALERLHFFGGKQVRSQASGLILKLNALLASPEFSH